jgi:hypothetical protein
MKKFKCQICGLQCKSFSGLGPHIARTHLIKPSDYYNDYIGTKGKCSFCGDPTIFLGLGHGYRPYCSTSCQMKERMSDEVYMKHWKKKKTKENRELWTRPGNKERRELAARNLREFLLIDHKENPELRKSYSARGGESLSRRRKEDPERYKDIFSDEELKRRSVEASKRIRDPENKFGQRYGKKYKYGGFLFRSSWELKLAKFLDKLGYEWEYEDTEIQLDKTHSYTPDFFLPELNLFIEVKPRCFTKKYREHAQAVKDLGYKFKFLTDMDTNGSWGRARKWLKKQAVLLKLYTD